MRYSSNREKRLWFWLIILVAIIYTTLGVSQPVALFLTDRNLLDNTYFALFLVIGVGSIAHGLMSKRSWREWIVWICIFVVFAMVFIRIEIPAERTHLIEYGAIGLLSLEALKERKSNGFDIPKPALLAVLLTTTIGLIDECIQHFIPSRIFDPIDIIFNFVAAALSISASEILAWTKRKFKK